MLPFGAMRAAALTKPQGPAYEAEAAALFARFTTPPTAARKGHINTLIKALKSAGVWPKLDALYVFAAADAQSARQNWKQDAFNATVISSPTFTADRGFTTDGAASYIDTNFNPATAASPKFAQNDASIGLWSRTSEPRSSAGMWLSGASGVTLNTRTAANLMTWRVNQSTTDASAAVVTDGSGWFSAGRSGAAATRGSRNGTQLLAGATPSSAVVSNNLYFGRASATSFVGMDFSVGLIGGYITATEDAALYSALLTYLQSVGAT